MANVFIDPGHGGRQPGAVKYVVEKDVNLVQSLACRDYLQANGVTVKMSRTGDTDTDINRSANEANAWGADVVVSIHNNAGGGDGFEVYYGIGSDMSGSKGLATYIEAEVKKLGQNSRGLKTKANSSGRDYYGIIRLTNMPAIICEGAFVDNKTDVAIIDTKAEQQAFGYAYARGILKYLGIPDKGLDGGKTETKPASKPAAVDGLYLVRVSKEINIYDAPLKVIDKCPKGAYTIVEEKNGFGKLKSSTKNNPKWIKLSEATKI